MTSLNDIRSTFVGYFADRGHEHVASGPLVPRNDATLMFTNSGMVQFKSLFTGKETRDCQRAVTSQKCVRAGGKHNDLENVGYTTRHHTFFEMLGNFSFGDYFKEQAIAYCWDLITQEFGVDPNRLLATVYAEDEEAHGLWKRIAGFSDDRIIRIPTADNFWSMGPVGPCGPCTELFYDYGDSVPGGPPGSADEDGDRFVEIWNLVFMQYEQHEDGSRTDLPSPSIDTGMGLERIGALLQGTNDNYRTDLFTALINASADITGTEPAGNFNVHHRVIADHLRSTAFLIAEGITPASDGRGYVLRRILRRAIRHVNLLGMTEPAIHRLVPVLVRSMGDAFPELARAEEMITATIMGEEKRFQSTLGRGLRLLEEATRSLGPGDSLPGQVAFKLYDTYGFPLDLTQDTLREHQIVIDVAGFDAAMQRQRDQSRQNWMGTDEQEHDAFWYDLHAMHGPSEFLGYETEELQGQILAIAADGKMQSAATGGAAVCLVCNQTPFYAEAGGQVGDTGDIRTEAGHLRVASTTAFQGMILHHGTVVDGTLRPGDDVELVVDAGSRQRIRRNHSATHLLNEALRTRLGTHVVQRGSLNDSIRLRFDFSHTHPLSLDDLQAIEATVNAHIEADAPVTTQFMDLEEARELGAQALFGEKYDDEVRVVSMGTLAGSGRGRDGQTFSIELCGGTHVRRTGEIGLFATTGDSSVAAGIRRIEALTGDAARRHLATQDDRLARIALLMKSSASDAVERVTALIKERQQLKATVRDLKQQLARAETARGTTARTYEEIDGVRFLGTLLETAAAGDLPALVDLEKQQIETGIVALISTSGGKAALAVGVTADLVDRISAVDIVRQTTPLLGGKGGGGRPDLARGGGPDAAAAPKALDRIRNCIGEH